MFGDIATRDLALTRISPDLIFGIKMAFRSYPVSVTFQTRAMILTLDKRNIPFPGCTVPLLYYVSLISNRVVTLVRFENCAFSVKFSSNRPKIHGISLIRYAKCTFHSRKSCSDVSAFTRDSINQTREVRLRFSRLFTDERYILNHHTFKPQTSNDSYITFLKQVQTSWQVKTKITLIFTDCEVKFAIFSCLVQNLL